MFSNHLKGGESILKQLNIINESADEMFMMIKKNELFPNLLEAWTYINTRAAGQVIYRHSKSSIWKAPNLPFSFIGILTPPLYMFLFHNTLLKMLSVNNKNVKVLYNPGSFFFSRT